MRRLLQEVEGARVVSLCCWGMRFLTVRHYCCALSAPEAEVVALSEALMPAVVIYESCFDIGLEVGQCPRTSLLSNLTVK